MEIDFSEYPSFRVIPIQDASQPGEARRVAAMMASELSFDEVKRGQVGIIVTELARNIALHGGGGHLILAGWRNHNKSWLDIMAVDKGPGIANVSRALEDGYSSAGTTGTGLGAVSRIASLFELFSQPKAGTAVMARVMDDSHSPKSVNIGGISLPVNGEEVCGDAFACARSASRTIFMMVDGLGHGPLAAEAAHQALAVFQKYSGDPPSEIIGRLHDALKAGRGAAVGIADIHHDKGTVSYCGVGNIVGLVLMPADGVARNMVSHNGIVGHQMSRVAEFTYPWTPSASLIMHSDGLKNHWNLKSYPGLLNKDPALIAAVLYRDQHRTRDDATVLVAGPRASQKAA